MQMPQSDMWEARVPGVRRSRTGLAGLLVSSLFLASCCTDCARLSQFGAATYSGPATTSGSNRQTSKQGGPSTATPNAALGKPSAPAALPVGAEAVGSAFYVNPKGQLLTTWGEVQNCRRVAILVDYEFRNATVLAGNPLNGLAVLNTGQRSPAHAIFRSAPVAEGEEISAFAHPILDGISLPLEIATGVARSSASPDGIQGIVQNSAILDDDAVGGPIVDKRGEVIGIVVRRLRPGWPGDIGYGIGNALILKFSAAAGVEIWERATAGIGDAGSGSDAAPYAGDYTVPVICFR